MVSRWGAGVIAGAAGTVALNVTTYHDMALRGRAASEVPAKLAGVVADRLGLDLGGGNAENGKADETAENRRTGIGALMGYVTGIGVAIGYGLLRPALGNVPQPLAGAGVALAAMAASDVSAAMAGVTDPRSWSVSDWALDFGFHLAYGVTTVISYDACIDE